MGSEIEFVEAKVGEPRIGGVKTDENETSRPVSHIEGRQKDPALNDRLEGAKLEAREALEATGESPARANSHADRILFLVQKLGGSLKSGRDEAEKRLALELDNSPEAVTALLNAGLLAPDQTLSDACKRLLKRNEIRTESQRTSGKDMSDKQAAIDEFLNGLIEPGHAKAAAKLKDSFLVRDENFDEKKAAQSVAHEQPGFSKEKDVNGKAESYESEVAGDILPFTEQSRQLFVRAGRLGFTANDDNNFQQLIKAADQLSMQSARNEREQILRNAVPATTSSTSIEVPPSISPALEELKSPHRVSARVRLNYAEALMDAGETVKARKALIEAMEKDKRIVNDHAFQQAFIALGGRYEKDMADAFLNAGGTDVMLKSAERSLIERNSAKIHLDAKFIWDGDISPDGVRSRNSTERAELMERWSKVLCGMNGGAEGQALLSRLQPILADPQLSRELLPALSKRLESCMAVGMYAPSSKPALSVVASLAKQGESEAVRLLTRVAGISASSDHRNFIHYAHDYISNDLLANVGLKKPRLSHPLQLREESVSTLAAKALVDIARDQPGRYAEIFNAVQNGWSKHGDLSKSKDLQWCTNELYKSLSPAKLAEQARTGDDTALLTLAYVSPGNKETSSLLLSLGIEKQHKDRVLNSIVRAADLACDTGRMLPLMAAALSEKTDISATKLSQKEALTVVAKEAKAGNRESLHFLMTTASDIWIQEKYSTNQENKQDQSPTFKLLAEMAGDPAHEATLVNAFLEMNKQRQTCEIPPDLFGIVLTAATGIPSDKPGATAASLNILEERARAGDDRSMRLLCLAAAGAGGESALSATENLRNLSDTQKRSREVLSVMLDTFRSSGDSGFLLETVGKIASRMPAVPADVRVVLTDAFWLSGDKVPSAHDGSPSTGTMFQQNSRSAVAGYMEINPPAKWDTATIDQISANPSNALTSWLASHMGAIPADKGRELTKNVVELLGNLSDEREQRAKAYAYGRLVEAMSPFATEDDVTQLIESSAYRSSEGRFTIGQTLLRLYDTGSESMRAKVVDSLIDNGWSEALQADVADLVADQIVAGNSSLDRLDKMFASVRNIDMPLPVAVQLKRLGVHQDYTDEHLIKLADDMVAKHGLEKINFILSSVGAYNSASQNVQGLLRSEGALRLGSDGHVLSSSPQTGGPLDMSAVADALASGKPSAEQSVLERLPMRLAELKEFSSKELDRMANTYTDIMSSREKKINHLKGVNGGGKGIPEVQTKLTEQLNSYTIHAQNLGRNIQALAEDVSAINNPLIAHRHSMLVSLGHTQKAHDLSLMAVADSSSRLPPALVEQFRSSGTWRSLALEGNPSAAQIRRLLTGEREYYDALGILRDYKAAFGKYNAKSGVGENTSERVALIERAVVEQGLRSISNSPSLQRLRDNVQQLQPFIHLGDAVRQLMGARASDPTAKYLHEQLQDMKKVLDQVKPEDIERARKIIADLQEVINDKAVDQSVKIATAKFVNDLSKLVEALDPGSKTGKDLRVLCNVKEEQLRDTTFLEDAGAALVYTLAAVATAAAVVCTLGASLPVLLLAVPTACFVTKEATAEGLRSSGYGEGSIIGAHNRGKVVVDKQTGELRMQTNDECFDALATSYAHDLKFGGYALVASKLGAGLRRVSWFGKSETLKAGTDQSSQIFKRIGADPLGPAARYQREVKRQLGPGMAMTGSEFGATKLGYAEQGAGLGVAFFHALLSKGRLPQRMRFNGEPEPLFSKLNSRSMLEQTGEGNFLKVGNSRVKLEQVPGSEKSANKQIEALPQKSQSADARVATDNSKLKFDQMMQPLKDAQALGMPLKGLERHQGLDRVTQEVLLPYARETARKLGIPPEVINEQSLMLKAMSGRDGSYGSGANLVEISTSSKNVRRAIDHELKHMSDAIKVTAAYHVDPQAVAAQIREQCLRDVGRTGDRVDFSPRFPLDAQTGLEMRALVQRAMEHFPHETVPDLKTVNEWLMKHNVSENLLKAHRNQAVLAAEVRSEFQNYSNTIRDNVIPKETIADSPALKQHLEKIQARYERWQQERGSLSSNPEFQMQFRSLARDLIGRRDGEVYQVARDEIRARRFDSAQEQNRFIHEDARSLSREARQKSAERINFLHEIKYGVVSEKLMTEYDAAATTTGVRSEAHFQNAQQYARELLKMSSPDNVGDQRTISFLHKAGLLTPAELKAANFVFESLGLDLHGIPSRLPQQMWPFGRRGETKSELPANNEGQQAAEKNWRRAIEAVGEGRKLEFSGSLSSRTATYEGNRETFLQALSKEGYLIQSGDFVVINNKPIKLIQRTNPIVDVFRVSDTKGKDVAISALNNSEASPLTIGRSGDASVALVTPGISRSHGRLGTDDKGIYFENLTDKTGNSSGTWVRKVNGGTFEVVPKGERVHLKDVAELWIGGKPEFPGARRLNVTKEFNVDKVEASALRIPECELLKQGELSSIKSYTGKKGVEATLYEGTLTSPTGEQLRVVIHTGATTKSVSRMHTELAAQQVHKLLGFDSGFPETASRLVTIDGKLCQAWLQPYRGEAIEWVMTTLAVQREGGHRSADLRRVMDKDPHVRSQLEQAFVERMILGDTDPHSLNFVVEMQGSKLKRISNIDVEDAFPVGMKHHTPRWHYDHPGLGINKSLFKAMADMPLTAETKAKVAEFVQKYDSKAGRAELTKLGLTEAQVEGVIQRARWFNEQGKLPGASQ